MNISLCITTFNEEGSIGALLDSLISQTKKPDEIVIVDGGSTDKTIEIINHYQKKYRNIKLLKEKCNRARGRNLSVEVAKNEIIAMTDAGCIAHKNWLEEIVSPFNIGKVDISAGFYKMVGKTPLQNAMGIFLGVTPDKFNNNFLPSTRSIAFRKSAWEATGGFPETTGNSAEDTDFNYKAVKIGLKYARVKTALVEWGMPIDLEAFFNKINSYAKWDVRYGIWLNQGNGLVSHNIRALSVVLRYLLGFVFFIFSFKYSYYFPILLICIFAYLIWAYRKAGIWGPVLQITSDMAVMSGFISGIIGR